MVDNSVPIPISVARDFAAAMGALARDEGKGYVKKVATAEGHTYVYDRSQSGKMAAKEIVRFANEFAQNALSVRGGSLEATELKDIEAGMAKLQGRLNAHQGEQGWFKKIFIRINYIALAQSVICPDYQGELTQKLANTTFKFTTNENALKGCCKTITIDCLNQGITLAEAKENHLIALFLLECPEFESLKGLIGNTASKELVKNNSSFKQISDGIKTRLDNYFTEQVGAQLEEVIKKIPSKKLSDCQKNQIFKDLIAKYKETYPQDAEKTDAEIVKTLTGISLIMPTRTTQKKETESKQNTEPPVEAAAQKSKEETSKSKSGKLQKVKSKAKSYVKSRFMGGRKSKSKGSESGGISSSQAASSLDEILASRAELSEQPTQLAMREPFSGLALKLDLGRTFEDRQHNAIRQGLLNSIMGKIDREEGNPTNFDSYIPKSIHGFYPRKDAHEISSAEKDRLEGENSLTHMFYLYRHLQTNPSNDPKIVELKKDLERSIPLAFEAAAIGGRSRAKEDSLSEKVYQELSKMKEGERLFLPTGCEGHATLLMMTKKENGMVEIEHFNTGYGMEEHAKLAIKTVGRAVSAGMNALSGDLPIGISLTVDLKSEAQIKRAVAGFIALSDVKGVKMEDLSEGFEILKDAGDGEIRISMSRKGQRAGNCSYDCLLAAFEQTLGARSFGHLQLGLIDRLNEDYSQIPESSRSEKDKKSLKALTDHKKKVERKLAIRAKENEGVQQTASSHSKKSGVVKQRPAAPVSSTRRTHRQKAS